MSQSTEKIELNIETILTLDDKNEPQAITVSGTGNMPRPAVRAIATEALEVFTGSVDSGYGVQLTPIQEDDGETVFEINKRVRFGTRQREPITAGTETLL